MIERSFRIDAVVFVDGGDDMAAEARAKYKEVFPGRSARRMTHLGMMVGVCLKKMEVRSEDPIIYASAFGESESLEKYIDSFPQASPALFQSSIHPSAVEQALIPGRQAVDRFYPITSDTHLLGQALEKCFLLGDEKVVLVGGEERGTWLCDFKLASDESFAFSIRLSRGEGGMGSVSIDRSQSPSLEDVVAFSTEVRALQIRERLRVPSFALDAWIQVDWL